MVIIWTWVQICQHQMCFLKSKDQVTHSWLIPFYSSYFLLVPTLPCTSQGHNRWPQNQPEPWTSTVRWVPLPLILDHEPYVTLENYRLQHSRIWISGTQQIHFRHSSTTKVWVCVSERMVRAFLSEQTKALWVWMQGFRCPTRTRR